MKLKNKEISLARECGIKIIYQHLIRGDSNQSIFNDFEDKRPYSKEYLNIIIRTFDKNSQVIKSTLSNNTDIKVQQITKIDCSILYLAILEFLYIKDAPKKVIINESILLAKKFHQMIRLNSSIKSLIKLEEK